MAELRFSGATFDDGTIGMLNRKPTKNILLLALMLAFNMVAPISAKAAPIPWAEQTVKITTKGKPVDEMLRELAARNDIAINVGKGVRGTVNGAFDMRPQALLEMLASNFGFVWYFDGALLDVTSAEDIRSQIVSLESTSVSSARSVLERLQLVEPRYPVVFDERSRTAKVSGPSRYVSLVAQAIQSIGDEAPASEILSTSTQRTAVRVVPLKYAWAKDFTYVVGGQTRILPGVATVMSSLYQASGVSPTVAVDDVAVRRESAIGNPQAIDQLRALGLAGTGTNMVPRSSGAISDEVSSGSPNSPLFVAEGRMNAVLVRDAPERLDAHERAIRSLDVKPGLVEIEARIIEVNSDAVASLGIDWRFRNRRLDAQVGGQPIPSLGFDSSGSEAQPSVGPNGAQEITPSPAGVLTTVLGDAGRYLITRVNALADDGKANLLSSPKLLTLDNVEATMEDIETLFVRVAGNLEVDLFDVSVGTTLRVTPLIVEEGGRDVVKMAITIEDGRLNGRRVDDIPTISRSRIRTQSIVGNGEALLIAGYTREAETSAQVGIPVLSSIPVVGWLFKSRTRQRQRVERLFMLTPRLVKP